MSLLLGCRRLHALLSSPVPGSWTYAAAAICLLAAIVPILRGSLSLLLQSCWNCIWRHAFKELTLLVSHAVAAERSTLAFTLLGTFAWLLSKLVLISIITPEGCPSPGVGLAFSGNLLMPCWA